MSDAAKHTPGPWEVKIGRKGAMSEVHSLGMGCDDYRVAYVLLDSNRHQAPIDEANAHLIAAAPDLKAACAARLECDETFEQGTKDWQDAVLKADGLMRAALAKSEGRA